MKKYILCLLVSCFSFSASAYVDPERAAIIELCSSQSKNTEQAFCEVQLLNATGHIFTKEEVEKTTDFQREFNDYLDNYKDFLSMAAEMYGIYYEVKRTKEVITSLENIVTNHPTNVMAVAFSSKRSSIYSSVIYSGIDILEDIKKLFYSKAKMNVKQKIDIISSIRPKLHKLNVQLRTLYRFIKYTTMCDVWREITGRCYEVKSRRDIAEKCRSRWKANVGMR